jgi:hypothetical protein
MSSRILRWLTFGAFSFLLFSSILPFPLTFLLFVAAFTKHERNTHFVPRLSFLFDLAHRLFFALLFSAVDLFFTRHVEFSDSRSVSSTSVPSLVVLFLFSSPRLVVRSRRSMRLRCREKGVRAGLVDGTADSVPSPSPSLTMDETSTDGLPVFTGRLSQDFAVHEARFVLLPSPLVSTRLTSSPNTGSRHSSPFTTSPYTLKKPLKRCNFPSLPRRAFPLSKKRVRRSGAFGMRDCGSVESAGEGKKGGGASPLSSTCDE